MYQLPVATDTNVNYSQNRGESAIFSAGGEQRAATSGFIPLCGLISESSAMGCSGVAPGQSEEDEMRLASSKGDWLREVKNKRVRVWSLMFSTADKQRFRESTVGGGATRLATTRPIYISSAKAGFFVGTAPSSVYKR